MSVPFPQSPRSDGHDGALTSDDAAGSRSRERHAPDVRRAEILDGALAVFSERGYARATLHDVADRVGVTKGCVYHHFASKEQLLLALIRDRTAESVQIADAERAKAGAEDESLEAHLQRLWRHFERPGQTEVAILTMNELAKTPDAAKLLFDEIIDPSRAPLRRAVARSTSASRKDSERAAVVIPLMVMGVAIGLRLFESIDPFEYSKAERAKLGETVTRILESGLEGFASDD
ncbi:MAG TPA: helix-turn-helix domain-containing protein [Gemmatimonadaceae bacterium]|nr:helix-turn-helix domain-containing protein [Gemmatimonadaceae bacterium]